MPKGIKKIYDRETGRTSMTWRKKQRAGQATTKKIKAVVKSMAETKILETDPTTSVSTAPQITSLSLIPNGTEDHEREGNEAFLTYLNYRLHFLSADASNVIRIIFLRQKGYSAPSADNILNTTTTGVGTYWIAPFTEEFNTSFDLLKDKTFTLKSGVTSTDYQKMLMGKIKINKQIKWSDASGSTPIEGAIWMYVCSDSGAVTHPTLDYGYTSLHYKDE